MFKILRYLFLFSTLSLFVSSCISNAYYEVKQPETIENCNFEDITGKTEIVFINQPPSLAKYGYGDIHYSPSLQSKSISYNQLVGKHGKIIGSIKNYFKIVLDNCQVVYAYRTFRKTKGEYTSENDIMGTYTISQYNTAKELIGKSIWVNQKRLGKYRKQHLYTDSDAISYSIKHLEKLSVEGILLSAIGHSYGLNHFFLIVKKETGEIGYIGYNKINFYVNDPIDSSWDTNVVTLINNNQVAIGMTKKQVLISWGEPDDINRTVGSWGTHEQWIYGDRYLYIENDVLKSFQD